MADENKTDTSKNLTGLQKAAALLITLGPDLCAKIFKSMTNEEVERLAAEIAQMQTLDSQTIAGIIQEFHNMISAGPSVVSGGLSFATAVLSKALGTETAMNTIERIRESNSVKPFDQLTLSPGSADLLFEMIKDEHPQTIALILSHVDEQRAAQILSLLPPDIQTDVIIRIANMKTVSPDIISQIEDSLREKSRGHERVHAGGIRAAANILNRTEIDVEEKIMESLTKVDPNLAEKISDLMFTYDDILLITDMGMQKLLQAVDENDLLLSLKASTDEIKAKFFKNMSERRRQAIQEDLKNMPPVRLRDVQAAQSRILVTAKEMIQSGEIEISRDQAQEVFI